MVTDDEAAGPIRTLILLRTLTLYPVVLSWHASPDPAEVVLLVALVASTALLALRWRTIAPRLRRHPAWAALDVLASLVVLAYAGPHSAFVAYTLTTAVLVGFLLNHLAATLVCTLMASGYLLLATLGDAQQRLGWAELGVPAGYVVLTLAGAAFRRIQDRLAAALEAAVAAERSAATAHERTRLARDLHDGVCSTLHGLVLQSTAVARTAEASDPAVAELARQLEDAARAALAQSREVLTGLRRDDDSAPLLQAVSDRVQRWSESTGIAASFSASGVAGGALTIAPAAPRPDLPHRPDRPGTLVRLELPRAVAG